MKLFHKFFYGYTPLESALRDSDIEITTKEKGLRPRWTTSLLLPCLLTAVVCFALCFANGRLASLGVRGFHRHVEATCRTPATRREWRTLNSVEKKDYVRAVWCLKTVPSKLGANQTLYDDFSWVHTIIGAYCECLSSCTVQL